MNSNIRNGIRLALLEARKYEQEYDELQSRFDRLKAHSQKQEKAIEGLIHISSQLAHTHPDKELVEKLDAEGDKIMEKLGEVPDADEGSEGGDLQPRPQG